jgi:hypothetical protein
VVSDSLISIIKAKILHTRVLRSFLSLNEAAFHDYGFIFFGVREGYIGEREDFADFGVL